MPLFCSEFAIYTYRGFDYLFAHGVATFSQAIKKCREKSATLASVKTQDLHDWLKKPLKLSRDFCSSTASKKYQHSLQIRIWD